jgi:hypothetical protein
MKLLINIFDFNIALYWCPAPVDIPENEAVNDLAKLATERTFHTLHHPPRTLSNIQQIFRTQFKFKKKKKPIIRNQVKLSTFPIKIYNSLKTLECGESCIIYQL